MLWRVECRKYTGVALENPTLEESKRNSNGQRERLKYDTVSSDISVDLHREL